MEYSLLLGRAEDDLISLEVSAVLHGDISTELDIYPRQILTIVYNKPGYTYKIGNNVTSRTATVHAVAGGLLQ